MEPKIITQDNSRRMIREALRKIALGRSIDRIEMAPGGMGGVGTARMVHGYVAKIHDDPSDEEFAEWGGTVDVGEYPDETASAGNIIHKGVLLSAAKDNTGGFLIVPALFSDVTLMMDAGARYAYLVNYTHAEVIRLDARQEASIGVTETEDLDPTDGNGPDYDELEPTGNATSTRYTAGQVVTTAANKNGKEATIILTPESIGQKVDKAELNQSADKLEGKVGSTAVTITDGKITLGDGQATEPLVLGNELAQLMLDFLTECSKITTPTLMGTMPAVNVPNFASLISKIQKFLSKTAFTK